jgi:hypothetical protein
MPKVHRNGSDEKQQIARLASDGGPGIGKCEEASSDLAVRRFASRVRALARLN